MCLSLPTFGPEFDDNPHCHINAHGHIEEGEGDGGVELAGTTLK
jgi:hypothetical protein